MTETLLYSMDQRAYEDDYNDDEDSVLTEVISETSERQEGDHSYGCLPHTSLSSPPDSGTDRPDSALLVHTSSDSCLNNPSAADKRRYLEDLDWYDGELEEGDCAVETTACCTGLSDQQIVPKIRYILICVYFAIYSVLMITFSRCSEEVSHSADNRRQIMNSVNGSITHACSGLENFLRSIRLPLISIIGAILLSLVTRGVMFLVALWRSTLKCAWATTVGPFRRPKNVLIVVVVIFAYYVVSVKAFNEEPYFEWEEAFAPAGLATLIVVTLGFEADTDFEERFKRKEEKDGYVYGLAHQYFKSSLKPLLRPDGKRKAVMEKWNNYGPSEMLLVLLVESYYLVEEFFTNGDYSEEASFVENVDGIYLMRLAVAKEEENAVYVNVPILLNEHLLVIDEWFSKTSHVTIPIEEQKLEYVESLRNFLRDESLPMGGAMGRVFFIHVPEEADIRSIPKRVRQAIYKELGRPNTDKFLENAKLADKGTEELNNDSGNDSDSQRSVDSQGSLDHQGSLDFRGSLDYRESLHSQGSPHEREN